MSQHLPATLVASAALAGGLLVFSGFRLYRVALASVGALAGLAAGWLVGSFFGSLEVAGALALVGAVAGALLVGPLEAALRFVAGGVAAAALARVVFTSPDAGGLLLSGLTVAAFLGGGIAAILLYRPLVVSAFAVCGGLLVAGASAVSHEPRLLQPGLGETAGSVAGVLGSGLGATLAVVAVCVGAALVLQSGDGPSPAGSRAGIRGGGVLMTALLAAGLAFTITRPAVLPGPVTAVTGVGPLSWPVAILLLRPSVALARRRDAGFGTAAGWALAVGYGLIVGLADAFLAGLFGSPAVRGTGFVAAFFGASADLRLLKVGWTVAAFPLLFTAMATAPAAGAGRDQDD